MRRPLEAPGGRPLIPRYLEQGVLDFYVEVERVEERVEQEKAPAASISGGRRQAFAVRPEKEGTDRPRPSQERGPERERCDVEDVEACP